MHFTTNAIDIDIDLTNGLYRLPCTGVTVKLIYISYYAVLH